MIQKLRRLLHLETTEEALRDFAEILEQGNVLKSEIDTMAREYLGSRAELDQWAAKEREPDVQELIKAQQDGLTSRYLAFLADKQTEHFRLEARKQFYTAKYPDFEKALSDLKKNDFIEHILTTYRDAALTLEESNTLIKAVTKTKVQYADNIVFNQLGELLIVQRQPLGGAKEGANLWVLPGGHVKMGEKSEVAAQRELLEETGYTAEDVYHVGDFDDDTVHIEYYATMIDTDEQSPVVDAAETRATEFVKLNKLYNYPTMYNIWDKVYEILGIEEHVVKIKKALVEGVVKNEKTELVVDDKINELIKGCGGGGVKAKFKKVMDKWKAGKLKSGESDETVTSQKQAIAIALSETGQSKEKAVEPVIEKAQKTSLIYHDKKTAPAGVKAQFGVVKLKPGAQEALPKIHKMHIRTEADGVNVYLVDGTFVRDKIYDDFTEGGNDAAYPDFVPVNEVWIDGNMCLKDIEATIVHEITERTAMLTDNQSYDKDHDKANVAEGKFRAGNKDLDDKAQHDTLHGGKADNLTLEDLAKKHKVDIEVLTKEYKAGLKVEREHTDDAEKAGEIARDHLFEIPDYYTRLAKMESEAGEKKKIEKAQYFRTVWPDDMTEFEKAKKLGHLVPKKVQIKGKNGQIHMAIRWVNPETGQPEQYAEGYKSGTKVEATTFEEAVEKIVASTMNKSDKVRNLIDLGIYDYKLITLLTGETQPGWYFTRSDINVKELPDQSKTILDEVRKEQSAGNDTPDEREANGLLRDGVSVDDLWNIYEKNLRRVIQGRHKFSLVYGTGGVGKTYTFDELVEKFELREFDEEIQPSKDQYDFVRVAGGRITPTQVYATMYRHRDKLIVFDDCDNVLSTPEVQGFLKGGLDTGVRTQISNQSSKKIYNIEGDVDSGTIPNTFSFKGRVIAITNLVAQQIDQAVKSRAMCVNLTMTVDETIERISKIKDKIPIWNAEKTEKIEVSQDARDYAWELFKKYKEKLGNDLNTRVYSKAVLIAEDGFIAGESREEIRKEIVSDFNSTRGSFDAMIRQIKGK